MEPAHNKPNELAYLSYTPVLRQLIIIIKESPFFNNYIVRSLTR